MDDRLECSRVQPFCLCFLPFWYGIVELEALSECLLRMVGGHICSGYVCVFKTLAEVIDGNLRRKTYSFQVDVRGKYHHHGPLVTYDLKPFPQSVLPPNPVGFL